MHNDAQGQVINVDENGQHEDPSQLNEIEYQ